MDQSPAQRQARLRALYEAHYSAVVAFVRRRSNASVAEDVAHETFLVAWRKLDDVPDDPRPWLFGVARHMLANERRRDVRRHALIDRLATVAPTNAPSPSADPGDGLISPEVREALESIPPLELEALLLIAWEGLSPADAAKVLGCTRVSFRARLYRARRRLAAALEALPESRRPAVSSTRALEEC